MPIGQDDDAPPPSSGSGRNAKADFHGEMRTNATHASTTDREAKLNRKSARTEAHLAVSATRSWRGGCADRRSTGAPPERVGWSFTFATAYDLVRLPKLLVAAA